MISKELFIDVIDDIRKSDDYQNWLNKQLQSNGVDGYLFQPTCVDTVIKLLQHIFADCDADMISYFCFELDYGRKWKPGMATKNNIDISTSEKLYEYLTLQEK